MRTTDRLSRLSRSQIKEADRVGGIELMILWPEDLLGPPPDDLGIDEEIDGGWRETVAAHLLIGRDCLEHGLVPVRVKVARVVRPRNLTPLGGEDAVHLAVILIGWRWVHASTKRQPRIAWGQ